MRWLAHHVLSSWDGPWICLKHHNCDLDLVGKSGIQKVPLVTLKREYSIRWRKSRDKTCGDLGFGMGQRSLIKSLGNEQLFKAIGWQPWKWSILRETDRPLRSLDEAKSDAWYSLICLQLTLIRRNKKNACSFTVTAWLARSIDIS